MSEDQNISVNGKKVKTTSYTLPYVSDDIANWECISLSSRFIDGQMDYYLNNIESNIEFRFYSGILNRSDILDRYMGMILDGAKGVYDQDSVLNNDDISSFKNLIYLSCHDIKGNIKLYNPKIIKILSVNSGQNYSNLSECTSIENLGLWGCSHLIAEKGWRNLSNLKAIKMIRPSLNNLDVLSNFDLRYLEIYGASKLEEISGIKEMSLGILDFNIRSCKKVRDMMLISSLKNAEIIHIENCADIESISFIDDMPNLKRFLITNTNILDGDVFRYLEKYKDIIHVYPLKRHYR